MNMIPVDIALSVLSDRHTQQRGFGPYSEASPYFFLISESPGYRGSAAPTSMKGYNWNKSFYFFKF